jgi:hypothetical protein
MAATVGTGNLAPAAAPGVYTGARLAAATPQSQPPADLRGLSGTMPQTMPGLIDAMLGNGSRNRGIVFGDTNHYDSSIHQLLANQDTLTALRRNGVTHIFVELPPEQLAAIRNDRPLSQSITGSPLFEYALWRRAPMHDLMKRAEAAEITVVPMDIIGPNSRSYFAEMNAMNDLKTREAPISGFPMGGAAASTRKVEAQAERLQKSYEPLMTERMRITNQVWVPRVVETMRAHPQARFVVLGGSYHIDNPVQLHEPDINHSDLNEVLAQRFSAPIPYVRIESALDSSMVVIRGGRAVYRSVPDVTIRAPALADPAVADGKRPVVQQIAPDDDLVAAVIVFLRVVGLERDRKQVIHDAPLHMY